eukprot:CAMPEP_0194271918 /NCGR_PEP_ID=MMETSP0169-20130528/5612_1 /TAXON_ID=218684 /ORGANISM="Corethron pennatum, Strain L29A3" /LENGTH=239 /DNA_ID=CAMNT_0039014431 /DNA_START=17 /DNA_END=736 /DNA_ORIENTATION=-
MSEESARKKESERIVNGPRLESCAVLASQARTVHFVRHAQATHNKAALEIGRGAYNDPAFHDARLTDVGEEQCAKLRPSVDLIASDVQLVLVSPCSRATETAVRCFQSVPSSAKWIALECLREKSGHHPCDGRRSVSELKNEFSKIDYSFMEDDEDAYGEMLGEKRETDEMIIARVHKFFEWLKNRPETNIAVITHSVLLSVLFNKVVICSSDLSKRFENCEMRTTHFTITRNDDSSQN